MKKITVFVLVLVILTLGVTVLVAQAVAPDKEKCTTIQSGLLVDSTGNPIEVGYDQWGYNYQAHMFNGFYGNASRPEFPVNSGISLIMKWNQAWMANVDCDGDLKLDRHDGYPTYIGSGAWLTNHMTGEYEGVDGEMCYWDYFTKIIAVPADATATGGFWYNADGTEIGPVIWGQFATIQEVENDECAGIEGVQYLSPDHPGFGGW